MRGSTLGRDLVLISDWYKAHCNDDWEHRWGVTLETLDNPGWRGRIALEGTDLARRERPSLNIARSATDWLEVGVRHDEVFDGLHFTFNCGVYNLEECLRLFVEWAHLDPDATQDR